MPFTTAHSSTAPKSDSSTLTGAFRTSLTSFRTICHSSSAGMAISSEKEEIPCSAIFSAACGGILSRTACQSSPAKYCSTSIAGSGISADAIFPIIIRHTAAIKRPFITVLIGTAAPRLFPAAV